jgi:hypothetical protein
VLSRFLVERASELDLLSAAAAAAREGRGAVITIAGEPGIGKTRLADEASYQARAAGMLVAWGRVWEAGGAPAFWPWVQIARALSRGGVDLPSELSRILPEHPGAEPPLALGADRFTLFDAVLRHLASAAGHQPLFLVLDDLHAADAPSLALADFVAPALIDLPVVLVVTYRDVEARLRRDRGDLLARLARSGHALWPARLSRAAVAELATALAERERSSPLSANDIDDLFRVSEGNPLYVGELLQVIRSSGSSPRIPDGVRAAIRAHLARLPDDLRAPLDVAAVIGREFTATALAELLEPALDLDTLVARLAAASAAGVLAEPTPMRFAFAHGLFREVLYDDLGTRRLAIHRRVAESLERLHANNPAAPLAEIATHWLAAGPASLVKARDTARRAAARAAAALAHEEAVELLERALQSHEQAEPANDALRADILTSLADAQTRAGDVATGKRTSSLAAALARELGDASAFARAALSRGAAISPGYVDPELVAMLEEARSRLVAERERGASSGADPCCAIAGCTPDPALEARILARLAAAKQPARDARGPVDLAREAIALLPDVCAEVRLSVLHSAMGAMMDIAHPRERRPLNEEAAQIASAIGEREILLRTLLRLFFDHADVGDLAGAETRLREVEALARSFPRASARAPVALGRSMLALLRGDDAGHETSFAEARRLAEGEPGLIAVLRIHQIGADRMRNRTDALASQRDEAVGLFAPWTNYLEAFDASLAARRADVEAAKTALDRLDRAHLKTCLDTFMLNWVAEGAAAAGDAAVGAIVGEALEAHVGEWTSVSLPGFIVEGPVSAARAFAAEACGRFEEAKRLRHEAVEEARHAGASAVVARLLSMDHANGQVHSAVAPLPAVSTRAGANLGLSFVREGEYWTVTGEGGDIRLRDSRGLSMLARLVAEPGCEIAALDLESPTALAIVDAGDAGELLDGSARAAYRRRLVELEEECAEAEAWNDPARLARARDESEALRSELSRAVGLGGRTRRAGGAAERARINVQRRIADAIRRIQEHHAGLGQHLSRTVRTGAYLSYLPERARR